MSKSNNTTGTSLRDKVRCMFNEDFNCIRLQILEKAYPELFECIIYPDNYFDNEDEALYPCWNTLFEAKDQILSKRLLEKVNELAEIGIFLMQTEETNVMMFIAGAGYDFYEAHWIPLYRDILQWI